MAKFEEKISEWMPLRLQIWRKGTAFFSPAERGAYLDLILAYWELGPLPNEDSVLQQLARVNDTKVWRLVRTKVLAKFNEIDGALTHARVDEERTVALQKYQKKSDAGRVGGQASVQAKSKQPLNSASSKIQAIVEAEPQAKSNTTYQEHSPGGENPEANASGKRKRASKISPDWKPTPQDTEHAEARNYSRENIEQLASHFRDYHLAKGTASYDWGASWRTWVKNDTKFAAQARGGAGRQQSRHDRPEPGSIVDLGHRLKARANLGGSGKRNDGMGRGGDGIHGSDDDAGNPSESGDAGGIVLDADECERMHRPVDRTEAPDESAAGTGEGPGGPTVALRAEAFGIPCGRGEEGPDDTAEHPDVVAVMGGDEGTAGPVYAAAPPPSGRVESYPESPDFPYRRHESDPTGH